MAAGFLKSEVQNLEANSLVHTTSLRATPEA